ncbi:hypothetical protein B0J13DRAFT_44321 [Dactylonectria estremocensis]|uniref:Uncharacterized protein n=1 Tax=Dactylonectria estremocensis TaxID=1079267 RepID=A0A9P9EUZ2_9HYPO|nr:hypothetical protein B0J13DRAFT_44321 [Dactylonectria estremocensis]
MSTPTPSLSSLLEKGSVENIEISSFETSAKIIKRNGWKIPPIHWEIQNDDSALNFIKLPPQRDKRRLLDKNRFRLLHVQHQPMDQRSDLTSIIRVATDHGWVGDRFKFFVENNTTGSATIESTENISFIAQSPADDDYPYFCVSVTDKYTNGYQRDADWVSLVLTDLGMPRAEVESLLVKESFPHDYPELRYLDFMLLPIVLLRWQVEQITTELNSIKNKIMKQDNTLLSSTIENAMEIRNHVFGMRRHHVMLHRRWTFAREFADNMVRCFNKIEKRNSRENNMVAYSSSLRDAVQTQDDILKILLYDLNTTLSRIQAQQTTIDNLISITIARNSQISAQEGLRDSRSMKTIAIVTLVFLPGTFVASLFSMSMFDWEAGRKEGQVVSAKWLWVFFAISVPLTLLVLLTWAWWHRRAERKFKARERDKLA